MSTPTLDTLHISAANLADPRDARDLVDLLDAYAQDIMGGSSPLPAHVRHELPAALSRRPGCHVFIARVGEEPAGLAICFEGFSTFACKPLLNLHDFAVVPTWRGRGIARRLMDTVVARARALGCCKVTLEVLSGNHVARALYASCGFADYALDPAAGQAMFMQHWID